MKAAILFSGRGSNMQALLEKANSENSDDYPIEYALAISNNPDAQGHEIAKNAGMNSLTLQSEEEIHRALKAHQVEIIFLAGYMKLLSAEFVERWYHRILNIHPSLLPKFKGLHPQQQALDANEKISGATVHIVTAQMDDGPILGQAEVQIFDDDSEESLSARILKEEHKLYPQIAEQYVMSLQTQPESDEGLMAVPFSAVKEECGIFAMYDEHDALPMMIFGLHALQHRGQEGVGIASLYHDEIYAHRRKGLVADNFSKDKMGQIELPGAHMIGHLRYSTSGGKASSNLQPFVMQTRFGPLAVAHNGNLSNADNLRRELMEAGQLFVTDSDSEIFLHLVAQSSADELKDAIIEAMKQVVGAFSVLFLSKEGIHAGRDSLGMRPLALGKRKGQIAIASESTALEATDIEWQYDIEAGELVHIDNKGQITREDYMARPKLIDQKFCAFEYVYFMRTNSAFNNRYTARVRERIGIQLSHEAPVEADYVVPVPESGIFAAIGYSEASKISFQFAILKSSYVGRTFIEPEQELRHFGVRLKLSIDRWHIKGKRIVLVDDSIVRANTLPKLIQLLRAAEAKEIHVRIASPAIRYPCFYGIDMPSRKELSANNFSHEELRKHIDADSLAFVSVDGLRRAIDAKENKMIKKNTAIEPYLGTCMACFTGEYPAPLCDKKMQAELQGSQAKFITEGPEVLFYKSRK